MSFSPENHDFLSHPPYDTQYEELTEAGWDEEIHVGLQRIDSDPIGNSKGLQASAEGIRSYRSGNIRILFAQCPHCIESGHVHLNDCHDCADLHGSDQEDPKEVIKLFAIEDISPFDRAS